jgi:hypothetical protein
MTRSRERNVQNRIVDCTVKATAGLPAVFSPGFGTTRQGRFQIDVADHVDWS